MHDLTISCCLYIVVAKTKINMKHKNQDSTMDFHWDFLGEHHYNYITTSYQGLQFLCVKNRQNSFLLLLLVDTILFVFSSSPEKIKAFTRPCSVTTEERTHLCLTFQAKVRSLCSEGVTHFNVNYYLNKHVIMYFLFSYFDLQCLTTSSMPSPRMLVSLIRWIIHQLKLSFLVLLSVYDRMWWMCLIGTEVWTMQAWFLTIFTGKCVLRICSESSSTSLLQYMQLYLDLH